MALTGYHRKHAIRLLREEPGAAKGTRERNRLYDEAVRQALTVLWEAADRVCGKRLKALIPKLVDAIERHGHLDLNPVVKAKLLQISAATIDRMLANARAHSDGQRKRRTGVGSAIRRSIPVRTFADWRDPPPGFFEIDMVEHCGGSKIDGEFVHTLTLTDIASGWTECVAMRVRNQMLVIEGFEKAAADLPFAMLGVDSDNDSAFMNQSVLDYCKGRSDFAAHGVRAEAAPAGESDVAVFLASLSSAWKEGEARPTHRKQPKAKHWWRSRVDPFADAWPLIEGWLIAEPSVPFNVLMDRLATMFPEAYASQAQLRTLQRRVKAWRAERVKELILGGLRKSADAPPEV
ncbi:hypothetical protein LJR267_009198 [Paraburkholderia hospita]